MIIDKTKTFENEDGIILYLKNQIPQFIWFDNQQERDIVFKHWQKAIEELEASKAVFRPVYESKDGDTHILKLRYTTPEEAMEVELTRRQHFGEGMKLVAIYNEAERTFQNVNF